MLTSIILAYLLYAIITAYTPGPNNIVALYAVGQHGWRQGKFILLGIALGFLVVMELCAIFCYKLLAYIPSIAPVLTYIGAAYIAYLAIKIMFSRPINEKNSIPIGFWQGFFLEFINIKIMLYAITIYTGYVLPSTPTSPLTLAFHGVILTIIGVSGNLTWALSGSVLQRLFTTYHRPISIIMGITLLWCASSLLFY